VRAALGARLKARVINHFARRLRDSANRACLARRVVLPNRLISLFTRDKTKSFPAEQADTEIVALVEPQGRVAPRLVAARSREDVSRQHLCPKTSLRFRKISREGVGRERSSFLLMAEIPSVPRVPRHEISRSYGKLEEKRRTRGAIRRAL